MNWHFIFFLLDVVGWMVIAVLVCNNASLIKSNKVNLNAITKLSVIIITIVTGLFSVLVNGLSDTGLSVISFIYAFFVSFSLVYYQLIRAKKVYLTKINKGHKKLAYI